MSDSDQDDRQVRGYERMLDRLRHRLEETEQAMGDNLREALEHARDRAVELGELTREEADKVAAWLRRDIDEAAQYTAHTQRNLADWLHMDLQLVESWIWDRFASVADRTRLEWLQLQRELGEAATYHTGEIAAPGALACRQCGEVLHFERAGHIPPCPRCRGTEFERVAQPASGE